MVKGFIFDLDGVLTETSKQHYLAWKEMAEKIGIMIDDEFNESLKGISREESLERILQRGSKQHNFSDEQKVELASSKNESYCKMISNFTKDNLFEGVLEMLETLKQNGIKIALGSASKNGVALLNSLGIIDYFDYVVDPSKVKGKPNPDIFLDGAKGLCLEPSECVGVEDAYSGVEAIKRAGMFAIGIGNAQILSNADLVFKDIKEMNVIKIISK